MTCNGHIEQGKVVLDEPTQLPEGARVRIEIVAAAHTGLPSAETQSLVERYRRVIGIAQKPARKRRRNGGLIPIWD